MKLHLPSLVGVLMASLLAGCGSPSEANIALRKENEALHVRLRELEAEAKASTANRIVSTRPGDGVDLGRLYTAAELSFGRLTGVEGNTLRVYVTPLDTRGDSLKSAGGFEVTAYDLARGPKALVGQWTFSPEQAAKAWNGKGFLYCYVLECPFEVAPVAAEKLRVRVTYQDLLTGRKISAERDAAVAR